MFKFGSSCLALGRTLYLFGFHLSSLLSKIRVMIDLTSVDTVTCQYLGG